MLSRSKHGIAVRRLSGDLVRDVYRENVAQFPIARRFSGNDLDIDLSRLTGGDRWMTPSALLMSTSFNPALPRELSSIQSYFVDPDTGEIGPSALPGWINVPEVQPRRVADPRIRQVVRERELSENIDFYRRMRALTGYAPGINMAFICAERIARREVLFARARLRASEGRRGSARPLPKKRHWRRSFFSMFGC